MGVRSWAGALEYRLHLVWGQGGGQPFKGVEGRTQDGRREVLRDQPVRVEIAEEVPEGAGQFRTSRASQSRSTGLEIRIKIGDREVAQTLWGTLLA
jgi:hypothetical protein